MNDPAAIGITKSYAAFVSLSPFRALARGRVSRRGLLQWGTTAVMLVLTGAPLMGCAPPARVLVTGGVDPERAAAYQTLALTSIPAVEDLWGTDTVPLPVRLELPSTLTEWAAATGHKPEQQGYAASTVRRGAAVNGGGTSQTVVGGNSSDDVRIVMHPDAYSELDAEGLLGVVVHEVTHLVMGTGHGAPWWLGEGAAEYTAHRTSVRSLEEIVGSAWEPLLRTSPMTWPAHDPEQPWRGYASAWLACVFIAETAGEKSLVALYETASAGTPFAEACREVLGRSEADVLQEWARWLSAQ